MGRAAEALSLSHVMDTEIDVLEVRCCALADFAEGGLHMAHEDAVAGVLLAFHGPLSGASLLAMEPEDALYWARAGLEIEDPIRRYVALGREVLEAVVDVTAEALGLSTETGEARLEENSLAGCLLRTHAPSDTAVLCAQLQISAGQRFGANLYLLLEPKRIAAVLGALSVATH